MQKTPRARRHLRGGVAIAAEPPARKSKRKVLEGTINGVVVVAVSDRWSAFAIELEDDTGRRRTIVMGSPIIESQFIHQIGQRVLLPVQRRDGRWHLRSDRKALRRMRKQGIHDRKRSVDEFCMERRRRDPDWSMWTSGRRFD